MIDVERRVVRGWRRLSTFLVRSRISCVGALVACLFAAGKARAEEPRSPPVQLSPAVTAGVWVLTVLVQVDDVFVLTDPVFTRTVGELSPRLVEPGLDPAQVPPLAAVLISHMHFDHLSYDSLDMLEHKTNVVLVPPGVRSVMPRYSFEIHELDRWQSYDAGAVRITAVPARHVG